MNLEICRINSFFFRTTKRRFLDHASNVCSIHEIKLATSTFWTLLIHKIWLPTSIFYESMYTRIYLGFTKYPIIVILNKTSGHHSGASLGVNVKKRLFRGHPSEPPDLVSSSSLAFPATYRRPCKLAGRLLRARAWFTPLLTFPILASDLPVSISRNVCFILESIKKGKQFILLSV